jgi:hypothetical protein
LICPERFQRERSERPPTEPSCSQPNVKAPKRCPPAACSLCPQRFQHICCERRPTGVCERSCRSVGQAVEMPSQPARRARAFPPLLRAVETVHVTAGSESTLKRASRGSKRLLKCCITGGIEHGTDMLGPPKTGVSTAGFWRSFSTGMAIQILTHISLYCY